MNYRISYIKFKFVGYNIIKNSIFDQMWDTSENVSEWLRVSEWDINKRVSAWVRSGEWEYENVNERASE